MTTLLLLLAITPALDAKNAADLRLNQIQVIGSHNSYHVRPPAALFKTVTTVAADAKEWDYSRQPLNEQFDHGVRSIELDMHLMGKEWLVMHVPLVDPGSTVRTFKDAITVAKKWSDEHPGHVPLSFLMELKEEGIMLGKAFRPPELADLETLDAQIREVFPADRLIAPDDVRGDYPTLHAAIKAHHWPTLGDCAGKVLFVMHETGRNRSLYTKEHPSLEGRAMFVESEPGADHAAVLVLNDPEDSRIPKMVREGYLVRTRGDTRTRRSEKERQAGLASGASIVTTDYPVGEAPAEIAFGLPEQAPARVNPVTGPQDLHGELLAEPISTGK